MIQLINPDIARSTSESSKSSDASGSASWDANRGEGSWDDFLKRHAATLWQCDFFSKRVLTWKGFRKLFVLVCLHVESRRVFVTPANYRPDGAWQVAL